MAPNNALSKSRVGEQDSKEDENTPSRGVITEQEVRERGDGVNRRVVLSDNVAAVELRRFLVAVMFLTRLPCPRWVDHNPRDLVPGMAYFPVIGSFVGLWAACWLDALNTVFPATPAASASTLAAVWITGCFHEDGLADTLDAFGGGWGAAQILRIMKDSRVGTYAVVGICLFLITKVSLVSSLAASSEHPFGFLVVAHTLARVPSMWLVKTCKYIHDEGDDKGLLYNTFAGCLKAGLLGWPRVLVSTLYAFAVCYAWFGPHHTVGFALLVVCVVHFAGRYGTHVIGGVIGDYLGAVIMIQELMVYMVLAAKWDAIDVGPLVETVINVISGAGTLDTLASCDWSFTYPFIRLFLIVAAPMWFMRGAGEIPPSSC